MPTKRQQAYPHRLDYEIKHVCAGRL